MIGQERLRRQLNSLDLITFPKSLLIVGDEGSGKHLLVNEIANHLNINVNELDEGLSLELINDIYISTLPTIYVLDMDKISKTKRNDIQQNKILKFLEEPPKEAFIILLSETKNIILNTILNRCQIWEMDPYSEEEQKEIYGDLTFKKYKSIHQPGQLINASTNDNQYLDKLTSNMIDNISRANTANILAIANKVDYRIEYKYVNDKESFPEIGDKNIVYIDVINRCRYKYENNSFTQIAELDINILLSCLKDKLIDLLADNFDYYKYHMFDLTTKLINDMKILNVDKKLLFENYLMNLKLLSYGN